MLELCIGLRLDGWLDRWMGGWVDGWMDEIQNGWMREFNVSYAQTIAL